MTLRQAIIGVQKELAEQYQTEISRISRDSPELEKYCRSYDNYFRQSHIEKTDKKEFESEIRNSDVVFVSGYHTLNGDKKRFTELIEKEIKHAKKPVIALEMFMKKHQRHVDDYLENKISEEELLEKVRYTKNWDFDWRQYKQVLYFAREHNLKILALNTNPGKNRTERRDINAAGAIAKYLKENQDSKIFVLFGESHVFKEHLPEKLEQRINVPYVILHQNPIELYWRLAEQKREKEKLVKVGEHQYASNTVPPALKLKSYLNFCDEKEEIESGENNRLEKILFLIKEICKPLEINVSKNKLNNLEVYSFHDLDFLKNLEDKLSEKEIEFIKKQISGGGNYFIPLKHRDIIFLGDFALDHVAEEAMHFIHKTFAGFKNKLGEEDAFYAVCVSEAIGYFGSKMINPERESFTEKDCMKYMKKLKKIEDLSPNVFIEITHMLGYVLGEKLYRAFEKGLCQARETIVEAMKKKIYEEGTAKETYDELSDFVAGIKLE